MKGSWGRRLGIALRARGSRAARDRRQRGAVLVEATLILPLIALLTFGAMEYGLAFNEQGDLRSAARSGARAASTQPKAPNADFEQAAVDALNGSAGNLPNATPTFALVYDAQDGMFEPTSTGECVSDCRILTWDGDEFVATGGAGWDPDDRAACAGNSDRVGVYVEAHHGFFTGLFGSDGLDLNARAVMALEPFPGDGCG